VELGAAQHVHAGRDAVVVDLAAGVEVGLVTAGAGRVEVEDDGDGVADARVVLPAAAAAEHAGVVALDDERNAVGRVTRPLGVTEVELGQNPSTPPGPLPVSTIFWPWVV
jgi:hypothetical protein